MLYSLMSVAPLTFHLIRFHSTLSEVARWTLPWDDTTLRSAIEGEWNEGDLYQRLAAVAGENGRLMSVTCLRHE
jgi:hypothetical protein